MPTTIKRLAVPALSVTLGGAMFAAAAVAGRVWFGVALFGVMLAYALMLVFSRDSKPVAMLAEESTDERRRLIQLKAGYFSLNVVALVVIGGFVIDILRGGDGGPWALIGAVGGASFVGALFVLSRRQ